jgi:hypothetical protein
MEGSCDDLCISDSSSDDRICQFVGINISMQLTAAFRCILFKKSQSEKKGFILVCSVTLE